jgi:hypothetical protein
VRQLIDGKLFLSTADPDGDIDMLEKVPSSTLELDLPQFKVRQALSREIYKKYQFDKVSVNFNRHSSLFTVKLLAETVTDDHFEYESVNTNEESDVEAASLAFQIEHEIERQ